MVLGRALQHGSEALLHTGPLLLGGLRLARVHQLLRPEHHHHGEPPRLGLHQDLVELQRREQPGPLQLPPRRMGTVPNSGTLGHSMTEGDFGHTLTRVLEATNVKTGGLQPKDCMQRLGHICDSVDQQWAPSPELDKDCSGIHNPRTANWAPSPGLEKRLGRSLDWAHQRDADRPRTAGDADNPKTAQPTQLPLGLNISDLAHMGSDPMTAQQDSQHPLGTAATSEDRKSTRLNSSH